MIEVNNLSGESIVLNVDGLSYVLPDGKTDLQVVDGAAFTVTFNDGGTGGGTGTGDGTGDGTGTGDPPPSGGTTFTEYGDLTIWDDSWSFQSTEAPSFYFMEGFVLGVLVFGTAYIIRIVKNIARQSPEV